MADRHHIGVLFCVLVLAAVGCTYLTGKTPDEQVEHTLEFNHELHLDEDMLCSDCHVGLAEEGGEPGFPSLSVCGDCHEDEEDEEDADPGSQARHFFTDDDAMLQAPVMALSEDVIFSHQVHSKDSEIACGTCHTGIETSTQITSAMRLSKADCLECHAKSGQGAPGVGNPTTCGKCHKKVGVDTAPASHALNWERRHGRFVRGESNKIQDQCSLCHTESTCVACHKDTEPESHNAFWRLKGHSLAASTERQRCTTCHQPDLCNQCHMNTAPRNHVAGWGSPGDRHCGSCHLDGSGRRGCTLCHQGAPSHASAPLQPASHSPGMNCRQCHGVGQPLPHRDTGVSCNACHR